MKNHFRRLISGFLSAAITLGTVMSGNVFADDSKKVDVWDFGGVLQEDGNGVYYNNMITTDFLDNLTEVNDGSDSSVPKGAFLTAGDVNFGGGMTVNVDAKDRLYYDVKTVVSDAGAASYVSDGKRSYGGQGKAVKEYDDYTAGGMYYANGKGGETRRYLAITGINAGDAVAVYTGPSNSTNSGVEFTCTSGGEQHDEYVVTGGEQEKVVFIAQHTGDYKIWFDATTNAGKPTVNRVVRYPAVDVKGSVNTNSLPLPDVYKIIFKNDKTKQETSAYVRENSFDVQLTPGFTYTAKISAAEGYSSIIGYGLTAGSKVIDVTYPDINGGKDVTVDVEVKSTYKISGAVKGFANDYDSSLLDVTFVPTDDSGADEVKATLERESASSSNYTYSATLEPDVLYETVIDGVCDYEVTEGGTVSGTKDLTQDILVSLKPLYNVSGKLISDTDCGVTDIYFINTEDGYGYKGTVSGDSYSANLRSGVYEVNLDQALAYTSTHVVVNDSDTVKDLLVIPELVPAIDVPWAADIYVGYGTEDQYHVQTMGEAMDLAMAMNPTSEAQRITVHIAPGTYREQLSVETPYLTFTNDDKGEVVLTWYYGIGYSYYSCDQSGYYNYESAFDKYAKNTPAKWGVATYIKKTATDFKAEGITFETSFSKYITDEEVADGVENNGGGTSGVERKLSSDPTTKAAVERSTALAVEAIRAEFKDCSFIGSQDTLYMGDNTTTYYKNCDVEGNTDFIFGSGNAVFDSCELRFCGYSDSQVGGYLTAGRSNGVTSYLGYLFRGCEISQKDGMKHDAEYFGRPWDAGAKITFLNTKIDKISAIAPEGWTEMSGVKPDKATFREYNTTFNGTPSNTESRVSGTVLSAQEAAAIEPLSYFEGWIPTYYTAETSPVAFTTDPYLTSKCDIAAPETGYLIEVKYFLGSNDVNDSSLISWYRVDDAGNRTLVKTNTGASNTGYKMVADDIGYFIEAEVTPILTSGAMGAAKAIRTGNKVVQGSGSTIADRESGKGVVFIAGDSTTKDYSAGALNNTGANRPEGSWGEFLNYFVDDNYYTVMDYAQGGRSARTFIEDGFFAKITDQMVSGDYLFIQFAHNDCSNANPDRYVPIGTPDANGVYPYTEGTFKWYLQKYVDAAKAVNATPVMVTAVSRMYFTSDGTIKTHHDDNTSSNDAYVTAAVQVAQDNNIECIDGFGITKKMYEDAYKADTAAVADVSPLATRLFAPGEKTHHSKLGGFAVATQIVKAVQASGLDLKYYLKLPKTMDITDDKDSTEFRVSTSGVFTGFDKDATGAYNTNNVDTYWTDYVNGALAEIKAALQEPPTGDDVIKGDLNGDKTINRADYVLASKFFAGKEAAINEKNADVTGDGTVNRADYVKLSQYFAGKITSFD